MNKKGISYVCIKKQKTNVMVFPFNCSLNEYMNCQNAMMQEFTMHFLIQNKISKFYACVCHDMLNTNYVQSIKDPTNGIGRSVKSSRGLH